MTLLTDDYETSRLHMVRYCETGSLKTPNHGRGKRKPLPNGKYTTVDDDDQEPRHATMEKVLCLSMNHCTSFSTHK